ncbi:MAG: hypothetical protein AAF664_15000 [Planctomycetota bacterium]
MSASAASPSLPIFGLLESSEDPAAVLAVAVDHFRQSRLPMELFEAIKMRVRHDLGLPLIAGEDDPAASDEVERQLENGLLEGCRESGRMLAEEGRIMEAWMYLRPVAEEPFVREIFNQIEIDDENFETLLQILLHEGVDVGRGYAAVLERQGTCNSITLYEQQIVGRSKEDRQICAKLLLKHFYKELSDVVAADISRRDKEHPETVNEDGSRQDLEQMLSKRRWVMKDGGYHLDTTHLAAAVRLAGVLDDPEAWRLARQLIGYGRQLSPEFQYPGEEPFTTFYPTYAMYFDVLMGRDVSTGLAFFERKAKEVDSSVHGAASIETYVDLLSRIGRFEMAIRAAVELAPDDLPSQRVVVMLLDVAKRAGAPSIYEPILEYCRSKNDVLGFGAVRHAQLQAASGDV